MIQLPVSEEHNKSYCGRRSCLHELKLVKYLKSHKKMRF